MCKGGASIQNYLATYASKLQPHLGGSVKAADTFAAIYANNMHQVQVPSPPTPSPTPSPNIINHPSLLMC